MAVVSLIICHSNKKKLKAKLRWHRFDSLYFYSLQAVGRVQILILDLSAQPFNRQIIQSEFPPT